MPDQLSSNRLHHMLDRRHPRRPTIGPLASETIRVGILELLDERALLSMLDRCSVTTLYRRFHGITDGIPYVRHCLSEVDHGESYVAWAAGTCVGLGNLHVCGDTAEIGILVEDDWQRRGVGTALLAELTHRVRSDGARYLRAEVIADDDFVLRTLSRFGPVQTSLAFGIITVSVDVGSGRVRYGSSGQPSYRGGGTASSSSSGSSADRGR